MEQKIAAIIVLYYPDVKDLFILIDKIIDSVNTIICIDNTPDNSNSEILLKCSENPQIIDYIALKENVGIAKAQNVGIRKILDNNIAEYIVFFDQDSTPNADLVIKLKESFIELTNSGKKIAAVAPVKINKHTKIPYKPRYTTQIDYLGKYSIRKVASNSGMMISIDALKDIGLMDEMLFIDSVDYEWCWRANSKNHKIVIVKDLFIEHLFGEGDRQILFWKLKISKPIRTYYQYRNSIKMIKRRYVPFSFKIHNIIDNTIKFFVYTILVKPRKLYFKYMVLGIIDGIVNKNNRY